MARVVLLEAVTNGYVVRCRGDAGCGAVAFSGDNSLKRALNHARMYMLAPPDAESGSSSFPFLAANEGEVESALEPKIVVPEEQLLAPTVAVPRQKPDPTAVTRILPPKWQRPT